MNNYLEILGLKPGVTEKEIKQAYRRLVKQYHPDVNKSPEATKKFLEISEAYKFLTEVGARPHQEPVSYDYNPYDDEYERWRAQAKAFAKKRREEAEANFRRVLLKIFWYFNFVAAAILITNIIWGIDFFLPEKVSHDKLLFSQKYFMSTGRGVSSYYYDILHFENHKVLIEKGLLLSNKNFNGTAVIFSTPISGNVRKLNLDPSIPSSFEYPVFSIYNPFGFLIPLMFLIAFAYFRWVTILENKFSWALVLILVFLFQLKIF